MGDQFQQALMTMFQLFSGMHQEQMSLIRQELARVHALDEKRTGIEARLAQLSPVISDERPRRAATPQSRVDLPEPRDGP